MNSLVTQKKQEKATRIQKFLRGYISRSKTMEVMKHRYLSDNFEFFDKVREKCREDAAIQIKYYFKRYMKRKAIKKAKKLAAQEAAKNKKYGRRAGKKK